MSTYLQHTRKEFKGQYKYSIDCDKIKSDPTSLNVLDGSVRVKHTMIINAIVKENFRKIVVKIGKTNELVKQEYDIAKRLESNNLTGFINMHCLFSCHNSTRFNINDSINTNNFEVCSPTNQTPNVDVLIMPFINGPNNKSCSLNDYLNAGGEPQRYKQILKQIIINHHNAFKKTGFVHKDMHFGNILLTADYEPIIMDYDTSEFNENQCYFWADIHRLFNDAMEKSYPSNKNSYRNDGITGIIVLLNTIMYIQTTGDLFDKSVNELISLLDASTITYVKQTPMNNLVYNPNVFGGKKTRRNKH